MTAYLQGMTRQKAAQYLDRNGRMKKPKVPAKKLKPNLIPRYPITVSVGCQKGEESFVTVRLSLAQLKEAARRAITGNGGYLETVERVRQFKDGTLLPNE